MSSSLIPERPLLISPTLAATIGLEEAVMLHVLSELMLTLPGTYIDKLRWTEMNQENLSAAMPFWNLGDIKRIQQNLLEKGLIRIDSAGTKPGHFRMAINQSRTGKTKQSSYTVTTTSQTRQPQNVEKVFNTSTGGRATFIPDDWHPTDELYYQCRQRNIPQSFIDERIRSFIIYWQERKKAQYSWHHTFLKYITREWEKEKSYQGARELETGMSAQWQPSDDVYSILEHAGISHSFIEDAIPEFVLYWRERGIVNSTWGTKFIAHVRRQWEKYTVAREHDSTPKLIPENYQPSDDVYEVLNLANIDLDFAQNQIREFVLYWQERKEVSASWHTKFLQHVKYKWAHRETEKGNILEKITDRSWAN